jgi:hypothetical protein
VFCGCVLPSHSEEKINRSKSALGQVANDCNQDTQFKRFKQFLPTDFCMPPGFIVYDVFEENDVDLNLDGYPDRLIKYYRKKWSCADTVFLSVYFMQKDSTFKLAKTFKNLYTPLVESFSDLTWLVKNCQQDNMSEYAWENIMWVRFANGLIIVPFAVDLSTGFDFYFSYDVNRKNWFLTKEHRWTIPDGGFERIYDKDAVSTTENLSIDNFRINKYLNRR